MQEGYLFKVEQIVFFLLSIDIMRKIANDKQTFYLLGDIDYKYEG